MGVIVDTSIWVDVERRRLAPGTLAEMLGDEPVYLAPPVIAELEYGVNRAQTPAQRNKRSAALAKIRKKPCLIIDRETGELFGKLAAGVDRGDRKQSRHRVHDLWLASLAIQHGFRLLTQNPRDFSDIPGLELISIRNG